MDKEELKVWMYSNYFNKYFKDMNTEQTIEVMLKDAELNLKLSKHIDKKYALMRYEIIMNHIRALKSL
jgi:hypothetical protein|tara:strand:- start:2271 stop:2474 length:204 start_codon:yes stop_codon:yes gene_type:complete